MVASFLTDAAVVVVVLGGLIFIHELGHFLVAKFFGVRVVTFSFGFGQRLLGIKHGRFSFGSLQDEDPNRTDYRVSLLPFGGYVRMAGDDPTQVHGGDPGEFLSHPRWQRFFIAAAGPAMNLLLALFLLAGLYAVHYEKPAYEEQPVRIGDVELDSPAAQAGLEPGDVVTQFGSLKNPTWGDVELKVPLMVGEHIPLVVQRGGETEHLVLIPEAKGPNRIGYAGWDPYDPAIIDKVEPGMPASKAGMKPGDDIIGVKGRRFYYWRRLPEMLASEKGNPVTLTVQRGAREFQVRVAAVRSMVMGQMMWRIGISFHSDVLVRRLPPLQAFDMSVQENVSGCFELFDVLGKILTQQLSPRSLAGPIGIAQISGQAYREGIVVLLGWMSFISLQLGILNLLPIPILDGGAILMLAVEGILRRDLSLEFKERFVQVGIVFLLLLTVFVMYNDIMRTVHPY